MTNEEAWALIMQKLITYSDCDYLLHAGAVLPLFKKDFLPILGYFLENSFLYFEISFHVQINNFKTLVH